MRRRELNIFRFAMAVLSSMIMATVIFVMLNIFSKEILLVALGATAMATTLLLLNSYYKLRLETNFKLSELERHKLRVTHPLYYYLIKKNISILNKKGKAKVDYHMECKNTSPKRLPQIKHEINFDGKLEDFSAYVNGKPFNTKVERRLFFRKEIKDEREFSVKQPYNLKLWFDVKSERIARNEDFEYDYTFICDELYPDMDKKGKEFTGVHITNPTELLVICIELPEDMKFVEEGIFIRVMERHDVRDCFEEERCQKFYPWSVSRDKRRLSWEVPNPKIACTYKLYFQVKKEEYKR
jgi:hypothetical protein